MSRNLEVRRSRIFLRQEHPESLILLGLNISAPASLSHSLSFPISPYLSPSRSMTFGMEGSTVIQWAHHFVILGFPPVKHGRLLSFCKETTTGLHLMLSYT